MTVLAALRAAVGALRRNPVLFLAGLFQGLVAAPQVLLQFVGVPFAPQLVQVLAFFVTPFVLAGTVAMAREALDVRTGLGTLVSGGKRHYVSVLAGSAIRAVLGIVAGIVFAVVVFFGAFGILASGGPNAATIGLLVLTAAAVAFLPYFLVLFFVQFFPVAIVVDGVGVVEGYKRSYRVVRRNLGTAFGYSLVAFGLTVLTLVPVLAVLVAQFAAAPGGFENVAETAAAIGESGLPFATAAVLALVVALTTVLLYPLQQAFAVAFYRRVRPPEFDERSTDAADDSSAGADQDCEDREGRDWPTADS